MLGRNLIQAASGNVVEAAASNAWEIKFATVGGADACYFTVSNQETKPYGVRFKTDGTKMYVTGSSSDRVQEYDLSTAWDCTTASYLQGFYVGSQLALPVDLFFKPDGTRLFVIGFSTDTVFQYDLSTAWDVSTASYNSVSKSVAAEESTPYGLFFKSDGTKMFVMGTSGDDVNEYDLSTAWDLSTATYSQNFSVSAQETGPQGLAFKTDGTIMYVMGTSGDDVNQYTLSTAWDVSTASYASKVFDVGDQFIIPAGLDFKSDGTRFYVVSQFSDAVVQYDVSTAWDISTASFPLASPTNDYLDVSGKTPNGLVFKDDGSKMFMMDGTNDAVAEYSLSTAWDITTASLSQTFSVSAQEVAPKGLEFKSDGTKMYVVGSGGDDVNEYNLSTAWDISTASYNQNFSVATQDTSPTDISFKTDGTKMYITGNTNNYVIEYDLSTAWDISTASYNQALIVTSREVTPEGLDFKSDGTRMYITGTSSDHVVQYNLSTAWDVSTATFAYQISVNPIEKAPRFVSFKPDGTKFFIGGNSQEIWAFTIT